MDGSDRPIGAHAAARLWIPRLAAYTGARIVELAALRREDCLHDQDGWSIRRGGGERAARRVIPLHRALVAQGFPAFVEICPPGLLFADDEASIARVAKTAMVGAKLGALEFRSRFLIAMCMTRADWRVADRILGRRPSYNKFRSRIPLAIMREAIERLPEFN